MWSGLFGDWPSALNLFAVRRCSVDLTPSQQRYLTYISRIGGGRSSTFYSPAESAVVKSVLLSGVPLFTKMRDGCRPFLEVFMSGDVRIASTSTDYDKLRVYNRATDSRIHFKDLNMTTDSKVDLSFVISHARSSVGARVLQAKMTGVKMLTLHLNVDMERRTETGPQTLTFRANELDLEEPDRFPQQFVLTLEMEFEGRNSGGEYPVSVHDPGVFFETASDMDDFREEFPNVSAPPPPTKKPPARPPPPRPATPPSKTIERSEAPSANLLNLSLDDPAPVDPLDPLVAPSGVDLLGGSLPPATTATTATTGSSCGSKSSGSKIGLDLLEDIFAPPTDLPRNSSTPNLVDAMDGMPPPGSGVLKPQAVPSNVPLKPVPVATIPRPASSSTLSSCSNNSNGNAKSGFQAPKAPHYSRSFFAEADGGSSTQTYKPKPMANFDDLLQGFNKTSDSSQNMTMGQLKKAEMVSLFLF